MDTRASLYIYYHDRVRFIQFLHTRSCRHQSSKLAKGNTNIPPMVIIQVQQFHSSIVRCPTRSRPTTPNTNTSDHHEPKQEINATSYLDTSERPLHQLPRSGPSGSTGSSIILPSSTRLRRRSKGNPCMVCKTGRAPTAIVVFAFTFWTEGETGDLSLLSESPHLRQKGIQRPCTRAWERRCWHSGMLLTASLGLAIIVFAYTSGLKSTAGRLSIFLASSCFKQTGIQRPCTKACERRC